MASGRLLGAALAAVAALAGGCATVPVSGDAAAISTASNQAQAFVQMLPPPGPGPGWSPPQVVAGFLHASADPTDYSAARQYLAPPLRKSWRPAREPITEVATPLGSLLLNSAPGRLNGQGAQVQSVIYTGQELATLTEDGQYVYQPLPVRHQYVFTLSRVGSSWLIEGLPSTLLLTSADFQLAYQPLSVYFPAQSADYLVPDTVFAPKQATNAELAARLVRALFSNNDSWLEGATTTDFPGGTRLLGVKVVGVTALVNLGGAAAQANGDELSDMAAQLVWTLTSPSSPFSSGPAQIRSVQLQINGQARRINGSVTQLLSMYSQLIPGASPPSPQAAAAAFFLTPDGGLVRLAGAGEGQQVTSPEGLGGLLPTAMAVSPPAPGSDQQIAVASGGADRCTVYLGSIGSASRLTAHPISSSTGCNSLSWDDAGDLWVSTGQSLWVVQSGQPLTVPPTQLNVQSLNGGQILQFRMAADGVRAALIVRTPKSVQLEKVAIRSSTSTRPGNQAPPVNFTLQQPIQVGTTISDPSALTWDGTDDLIVLASSQLLQVPLNGSAGIPVGSVPADTTSISGNGLDLVAVTSSGRILRESGPQGNWSQEGQGRLAAYPG